MKSVICADFNKLQPPHRVLWVLGVRWICIQYYGPEMVQNAIIKIFYGPKVNRNRSLATRNIFFSSGDCYYGSVWWNYLAFWSVILSIRCYCPQIICRQCLICLCDARCYDMFYVRRTTQVHWKSFSFCLFILFANSSTKQMEKRATKRWLNAHPNEIIIQKRWN